MTDSTLSNKYSDLRLAIAHYLGFGLTSGKWSTDQQTIIGMVLKKGLSQFYVPPKLYADEAPYEWSFLKPTTSITTIASYSTGTIAVTKTGTTVTLTDGTWPSWAATHGEIVIDTVAYAIDSRTDGEFIELVDDWAEDTETAAEYTLRHDGNYDMPDNYGGIEGRMTYSSSDNKPDILIVGEERIRSERRHRTARSYPGFVAVRPKSSDLSGGQRFEAMFFPIPNDVYILSYRQILLMNTLTSDEYPYGSALHSDTIEASCIAAAEIQEDEKRGPQWDNFMTRLGASIAVDQKMNRSEYFGYCGDGSDGVGKYDQHHRHDRHHHGTNLITYNGEI